MKKIIFSFFAITFFMIACKKLDDPTAPVIASDMVKIEFDQPAVIADGISILQINVELSDVVSSASRITISTSYGHLDSNLTTLSSSQPRNVTITTIGRQAKAYLLADSIADRDSVLIDISIGNIHFTKSIQLNRAFPDDLLVTANRDSFSVNNDSAIVDVSAFRNIGKASKGLQIFFTVQPAPSSNASGIVPAFAILNNNRVNAVIKSYNQQPGELDVSAFCLLENGDTLRRTIRINAY